MMAFCWLVRSDSSDTSKETVPLPSSMLVRRKIPADAVRFESQLQSIRVAELHVSRPWTQMQGG